MQNYQIHANNTSTLAGFSNRYRGGGGGGCKGVCVCVSREDETEDIEQTLYTGLSYLGAELPDIICKQYINSCWFQEQILEGGLKRG